ncbi:unnamed protein product [Linum tenue]|uniref:Uncharacterized protein n=1 Tax=Linum tenue TaxID=586396 RepID=A0AAV0KL46_9ROSI|nr:unnamed protein product [Linum tenue]
MIEKTDTSQRGQREETGVWWRGPDHFFMEWKSDKEEIVAVRIQKRRRRELGGNPEEASTLTYFQAKMKEGS